MPVWNSEIVNVSGERAFEIPTSMENLDNPKPGSALVRLPQDGKVSEMNVLISRYCNDMYITASEWHEELASRQEEEKDREDS